MNASEKKCVWEQRWHPLRLEWVLYTSHRGGRPWIGDTFARKEEKIPPYDPTCALCPSNKRIEKTNPDYRGTYLFTNDLPCFRSDAGSSESSDDLYRSRPASGTAEVICYHHDHSKTFCELTSEESFAVVKLWRDRYVELGKRSDVDHVLIFENKGSLVGTSNPHPHCQVYAGNLIYGFTEKEVQSSREYFKKTGRYLLEAIVDRELTANRIICKNDDFVAFVPWFARYAYEIMIFPLRQKPSLQALNEHEQKELGKIMREVAIRYDNLWSLPMPYVMAIHQAPTNDEDYSCYPFHIEYHPPLRKPDTMKYLAGPEIGGGSMTNESDPDEKAAELKAASNVLYRVKSV